MSCFEQSTFVRNHEVLNLDVLEQACSTLGWTCVRQHNSLVVTQVSHGNQTQGEPVLTVTGSQVSWNRYYRRDGRSLSNTLQAEYGKLYDSLQVQYAYNSVVKAFTSRRFTLIPDQTFQANDEVKHRFWMKGRSKQKGETNVTTKIRFEVLKDGTIQTDSDYIPRDVHDLADEAMEHLALLVGNPRSISPKEIPAKYRDKAFCQPKNTIHLNQK